MEIRTLDHDDLESVLELYRHLHVKDDPLPKKELVHNIWTKILGNPDHFYFGAFDDGLIIASCTLIIIPNLTRSCKPYGVIENVVTRNDYRRMGIGRAILRHSLECAWSNHCYKVMLMTGRKDEGVFSFYESVGFNRHQKQAFIAKP